MEYLRENGIADLHSRVIRIARSSKFTRVPDDIASEVEALSAGLRALLINTAEHDDTYETLPLFLACQAAKEDMVTTFLGWEAQPTVQTFEILFTMDTITAKSIILALLQKTTQNVAGEVFWLACKYNEGHIGSMVISMLACPFEDFHEVVTACNEMVAIIHQYQSSISGVRNERVAGLLLAALCDQGPVLPALYDTSGVRPEEQAQIYIVFGAANIMANKIDQGTAIWKMAIESFGTKGRLPKYSNLTEIGILEDVQEFRSWYEVDRMNENDALLQALMVIERCFGRGLLLLSALLARPYTERLCVYSLQLAIRLNKLTNENLQRIDDKLTKLSIYRHGNVSTVMDLLDCCLDAIGHLTVGSASAIQKQHDATQPSPEYDDQLMMDVTSQERGLLYRMERQRPLIGIILSEFIARVLLTLEWVNLDINDNRLRFVLQRIIRACAVMNDSPYVIVRASTLHALDPGRVNISHILKFFGAT